MLKLIFASNNEFKLKETKRILKNLHIEGVENIEILSLSDVGIDIDVKEDMSTLEENAIKKAVAVFSAYGSKHDNYMVFAEDFGFFIDELPKVAGLHSNRWYRGTDDDRNDKVLKLMKKIDNRECHYKTIFALYDGKIERVFGGYTYGKVSLEKRGTNGFAYDSIFELENKKTIAELEDDEKDEISCRRHAFESMIKAIIESENDRLIVG